MEPHELIEMRLRARRREQHIDTSRENTREDVRWRCKQAGEWLDEFTALSPFFALCNTTFCPRQAYCRRAQKLMANSVCWVNSWHCQAADYEEFVPISENSLAV